MKKEKPIHWAVNDAGLDFIACQRFLNLTARGWKSTNIMDKVTCQNCRHTNVFSNIEQEKKAIRKDTNENQDC